MRPDTQDASDVARAPLVVEFFGMPGAGKTVWHDRIVDRLESRGWRVGVDDYPRRARSRRALLKLAVAAREAWRGSGAAQTIRSAVAGTRPAAYPRAARVLLNLFYVRGSLRRQAAGFPLLARDQGCAQALWSLHWSAPGDPSGPVIGWADVRADLPLRFLVVHVDVTKALAGERARSRLRASSPIDGPAQDAAAVDRAWAVTNRVRGLLDAAAVDDPRLHVTTLAAGPNEDEAETQLLARIEHLLAATAGATP
jgi:hypothetical protein